MRSWEELLEFARIFGESARGGELDRLAARKVVEVGVEQGREDLADAVGAEIADDQPIAILHAAIAVNDRRQDEFVVEVRCVAAFHRLQRIRRGLALALDQRAIGPLDTVPTLVTIHCVVAPAHCRDANGIAALERGVEFRQELLGATRRRVASVEKRVHCNRYPRVGKDLGECRDVILMRMDTAGRQESHEMGRAAALLERGDEACKMLIPGQRAVFHCLIDAGQILQYDPPGADIHVADFGIAHLTLG